MSKMLDIMYQIELPYDVDYDSDDSKYGKQHAIRGGVQGIGAWEGTQGEVETGTKHTGQMVILKEKK